MAKVKVKLGKKATKDFAFTISDAKGNIIKQSGSKKGIAKLRKKLGK